MEYANVIATVSLRLSFTTFTELHFVIFDGLLVVSARGSVVIAHRDVNRACKVHRYECPNDVQGDVEPA